MHDIVLYMSCVPYVVLSANILITVSSNKAASRPYLNRKILRENTVENDTVDKHGDASGWETENVRSELIIKLCYNNNIP